MNTLTKVAIGSVVIVGLGIVLYHVLGPKGEVVYECEYCGQRFSHLGDAAGHVMAETGCSYDKIAYQFVGIENNSSAKYGRYFVYKIFCQS